MLIYLVLPLNLLYMATPKTSTSLLSIIFLTVFIDMLGISIVIPVIPVLFFEPDCGFFAAATAMDSRSVMYGFLVAIYPLFQFFGAPLLGSLSDRYGRKPVLTVSLIGTMIGYSLFAVAIYQQNLWLLFFSRALPGFTGGNISVIYSALADISAPADKAKNFGLVGAAFGIGFILGPTIGGLLADNTIVHWFNAATPFWVTTALTFINLCLVRWRFPETLQQSRQSRLSLLSGFRNIALSFQLPRLRLIFTVVLLISLGFTFFTQFFSVLLIQKFAFTEKSIGLLYGWVGIWLALTQGLIVRRLSGRVSPFKLLNFSILALSIAIVVLLIPDQSWWFYVTNPFIAIAQGITSPNLTAVVSEQATSDQQGQILGINQSMQSLGTLLPPMVAGYLNTINGNFPLLAGASLVFLAWLVYVIGFRRGRISVVDSH